MQITQQYLKECLRYNSGSGVFTWLRRPAHHFKNKRAHSIWNSRFSGVSAGIYRLNPKSGKSYSLIRLTKKGKSARYQAHRLAFLYMTGRLPYNEVDHLDGDGCNNAWSNLRDVSRLTNQKNKKLFSSNSSGFCGVSWYSKRKLWYSYITHNGKMKSLGYFDSLLDAVAERIRANIKGYSD